MKNATQTKQLDLFYETCRQNKLSITPQRTAIYQAVINSENHPCADDIFRIVNRVFPNISFDTVNRTLLTFAQIGLLTVAESYKGSRRFDPNVEDHHHMHCLKCGRILDFKNNEFDQLKVPKQWMNSFARILSSRVVFSGICKDCHKKRTELTKQ